ncbi:MAG: hypothetical protein ACR2HN_11555 [Tepidiformaceae bacterium]
MDSPVCPRTHDDDLHDWRRSLAPVREPAQAAPPAVLSRLLDRARDTRDP